MAYEFSALKQQIQEKKDWLSREFSGLRSGQASPAILDNIKVDSYGSKLPIVQVGSVGVEDVRTLRVTPWDASQVRSIERAVQEADLGVSVVTDEKGLRVIFPELTGERRAQIGKVVKDKLEQARISLRQARDDAKTEIQKQEKANELTEDERKRALDEMQKLIDEANKELEQMAKRKDEEIQG